MSPSDGASLVSTIPGLTGKGTNVAEVLIEILRTSDGIQKKLTPPPGTPIEISFTHKDPNPTHNRPHGIHWTARGLNANEWIEVQLDTSFPGFKLKPKNFGTPWWEHLQRLFPTAMVLPSGAFGWQLTAALSEAVSGHASAIDRFTLKGRVPNGRPLLRYSIVIFDDKNLEQAIDPDVDVDPDP